MSGLSRFKAKNHPQQLATREATPRMFGLDIDPTDEIDDRGTPQEFFNLWDKGFHFTVDVAASEANHKCAQFYTVEENGLEQDWGGGDGLVQPSLLQHRALGSQGARGNHSRDGHALAS